MHGLVIMSNHTHLIATAKEGFELVNIIRDLKKYISKMITTSIGINMQESRKNWMIWMFEQAGSKSSIVKGYQF